MNGTSYLLLAYYSLKESLVYIKNTMVFLLFSAFGLLIQYSAWYALYWSVDFMPVMGRSFETMLSYQILMVLIRSFTDANGISRQLEQRMVSGEIALDFLRPVAPRGMLIARSWGEKIFQMATDLVVFSVAVLAVGGIQSPASIEMMGLFLLSLCLGYLINLMFELLMGTFAFWFVEVNTLKWFIDFFQLAMSGAIVPLWLLPDWLQFCTKLLPFQAILYAPAQIYLGGMSNMEIVQTMGLQVFWILLLMGLQELLWRRRKRRIVVLGG